MKFIKLKYLKPILLYPAVKQILSESMGIPREMIIANAPYLLISAKAFSFFDLSYWKEERLPAKYPIPEETITEKSESNAPIKNPKIIPLTNITILDGTGRNISDASTTKLTKLYSVKLD